MVGTLPDQTANHPVARTPARHFGTGYTHLSQFLGHPDALPMETSQQGSAADLEALAARVADPGIGACLTSLAERFSDQHATLDLKTRLAYVNELRESIENVKDAEGARVIPTLIPVLFQILKAGEPVFKKDTSEYQFRRTIIEIVNRVPYNEAFRPMLPSLMTEFLRIMRNDNEENAVSCCKTFMELCRLFRPPAASEENMLEVVSIFTDCLTSTRSCVQEWLSETSPMIDINAALPSLGSLKLLTELGTSIVMLAQLRRDLLLAPLTGLIPLVLDVLRTQSPAQQRAREESEAAGAPWSGVAPSLKNVQLQTDLLLAQTKVCV